MLGTRELDGNLTTARITGNQAAHCSCREARIDNTHHLIGQEPLQVIVVPLRVLIHAVIQHARVSSRPALGITQEADRLQVCPARDESHGQLVPLPVTFELGDNKLSAVGQKS